jgi:protoporphyrinogen oxidase
MISSPPIRIIGGGMTGLTVALRLAQRGLRVVVHERDPYLGGLASEGTLHGVPIERFYHCVLPTDTTLLSLFRDIGIESEVAWNRTRTGFFHDGSLIEMTTTADFARFPALNVVDRARLAWTIGYCGLNRDWRRFDNEPVSRFLRRHGGERLFNAIWEPLLISKLGKEYDRFAASFIWATISRMLSARKQKDRSEKLGFVRGRYGKVFIALRKAIETRGGEVCVSSAVTSIQRDAAGSSLWNVHADGEALPASGIVVCTPAPLAAVWLKDSLPDVSRSLAMEYLGVVCEVLLLKRTITPYYVLNLTDRRLPFTGVIEFSNLAGREECGGHTVVYLPRYAGPTAAVWDVDDAQLHRENMEGLRLIAPDLADADLVAWQMNRARFVQPIHGVGTGHQLPPVTLAPGLAYLSTAQIYPWPIFNDAVVRHVNEHLQAILKTLCVSNSEKRVCSEKPS